MIFNAPDISACVNGHPAIFSFTTGVEKVTGQKDWNQGEKIYYLRLDEAVIYSGMIVDYDPHEPWSTCYSHSDSDIHQMVN